jgi:hypothetical protein
MESTFAAKLAELLVLNSAGMQSFIFSSTVIPVLAVSTFQNYY